MTSVFDHQPTSGELGGYLAGYWPGYFRPARSDSCSFADGAITSPLPPWVPSRHRVQTFLFTSTCYTDFVHRRAPDFGDTPNTLKTGLPLSAHGPTRSMFYRPVGSVSVVAQLNEDETLAHAALTWWQTIVPLLLVLTLGIIGELFVPKFPLGIQRREFRVYKLVGTASILGACIWSHSIHNQGLTFRSCNPRRF